jgi:tetratricopeptide (TPR) repeat protein
VAESQCRLLIETINRVVDKSKETSDNNSLTTSLTLLQANAKYQLGWLLFYQPLGLELPQFKPENIAESQKLFREVIDTRKKLLPKKDRSLGIAYAGLAASLLNSKETEQEAIITVAHAMEIFNASDQENSFGSFLIEYNRAEKLRYRDNNYEEAEKQYVKLANFIVNQVGEGHPVFAIHCWNMVGMYRKWGQFDKAEQMIARIRKTVNQCPSIRCSQVHLDCLKQYAEALQENGRSFEAKEVYQEILRFASERSNLHTQLISLVEEGLKQE